MKHIDFTKPGGFPLKQPTLDFMQSARQELADAVISWFTRESVFSAEAYSTNYILSGVTEYTSGGVTMVSEGWIIRNGELLYFAGGSLADVTNDGIGTQEIIDSAEFQDSTTHDVYFTKYAVVGGTSAIPLSNYHRIVNINDLRPMLARRVTQYLPELAAGTTTVIDVNVPKASVGDVVIVAVTANPEFSQEHTLTEWLSYRGVVLENNKVRIFFNNMHSSAAALDGNYIINIRILK